MAREVMNTKAVAAHFDCTPRQAREIMREIGLIQIGHGYVYRDALERYVAQRVDHTTFTTPILQQDYNPKKPRYPRVKKEA